MKKIIILLLFSSQIIIAQFRFNKVEYFTFSTSIDPTSSKNEGGLDIVGEVEYAGFLYVKIGFESFSVLEGGYKDVHWAFGPNFILDSKKRWRCYSGLRTAAVFRNGGHAINFGFEAGTDFNINDNFFIGLRATIDKRNDQKEIMGWNAEKKFSGFVRIGYKIYWKKDKRESWTILRN